MYNGLTDYTISIMETGFFFPPSETNQDQMLETRNRNEQTEQSEAKQMPSYPIRTGWHQPDSISQIMGSYHQRNK